MHRRNGNTTGFSWTFSALFARCVALICISVLALSALPSHASAETRTLKLYFTHTKERATITFKRNGKYDEAGLRKLNRFLRDHRRGESIRMDPQLFDIVWEAYNAVGARDYIHVVSAYRSPATNAMLRRTRGGQARKSQHMLGKAMDFYIPGVSSQKLREVGFKLQGGGVGYYPKSASPYVHFDTGNVRAWPRMSRAQLTRLFPRGGTLHLPPDGKPLPGYQQALADYKSRKARGQATVNRGSSGGPRRSGNLLAALFGGGADEDEDTADAVAATRPTARPTNQARPQAPVVARQAARPDTPETILAALPTTQMPRPTVAPRSVGAGVPVVVTPPAAAPVAEPVAAPAPTALPDETNAPRPPQDVAPQDDIAQTQETLLASLPATALPRPVNRPAVLLARVEPTDAERRTAAEIEAALAASNAPATTELGLRNTIASAQAENERLAIVAALRGSASERAVDAIDRLASRPIRPVATPPVSDAPADILSKSARLPVPAQRAREAANADPTLTAALIEEPVATTPKAPRPDPALASESRPDNIVAAVPAPIDQAIMTNRMTTAVSLAQLAPQERPDFMKNASRAAPDSVYTQGFSRAPMPSNTDSFTGNAVTFLAVAKFEGGFAGGEPLQIQIPAIN